MYGVNWTGKDCWIWKNQTKFNCKARELMNGANWTEGDWKMCKNQAQFNCQAREGIEQAEL